MAIRSILRPGNGWVVTEEGRHDLATAPTCNCKPKLDGLLMSCPDCGTVYGYLRDGSPWSTVSREKF